MCKSNINDERQTAANNHRRHLRQSQCFKMSSSKHCSPADTTRKFTHIRIIKLHAKPIKILRPVGVTTSMSPVVNLDYTILSNT